MFLLFSWTLSQGQSYHITSYGITSGLGRPDVSCIFLDSRGTLWVGTSGAGLYQFGPGRFSQTTVLPEVSGYTITQIGEDRAGYLYFLSETGLFRYDGDDVVNLVRTQEISGFALNEAGLWWSAGDSLYLLNSAGNILREALKSDLIISLNPASRNILAVGGTELILVDDAMNLDESFTLKVNAQQWQSYAFDTDSTIWIVSDDGMLLHYNGFDNPILNTGQTQVTDVGLGALGSYWLAGKQGVSIYQELDSSLIALHIGSPVNCLYFDRYDRLWMGSATEGLLRYYGEQHRVWPIQRQGIPQVLPGKTTEQSTLFLPSGQLTSFADNVPALAAPSDGDIRQVYRDVLSRFWTLTADQLWMYYDTAWVVMDSTQHIQDANIVGSDHLGNIWIAQGQSIVRHGIKPVAFPAGITFSPTKITGPIPADQTVLVLSNKSGVVVRIGEHSVGRIMKDHYEQTHQMTYSILTADLDSAGMVWLGTQASGVFRLIPERGKISKPLSTTYPLRGSDVVFVKHTTRSVIVGTDRSILRMHTDTSALKVIKVEVLNEEAGILLSDLSVSQFAVTGDGRVLVAAENEVIEFELKQNVVVDDIPSVFISRVLVNGSDIRDMAYHTTLGPFCRQLQTPEFSYSENSIAFTFTGSSVDDEILSYQWRLVGLQEGWTAQTPTNEVQFKNLRPGIYTLEVRVCDPSGNCSILAEPWRFVIKKAMWQLPWFWALAGIGILALSWFFYHLRSKGRQKEAEREKRRLEAELNALTLEQKSLQLQMNPHFIFNALQTLRSHIHEDKLDVARVNLTHFSKLMRMMLEMSRSEIITLDDELEFLQAYIEVEKMSHHLPVIFNLDLDENVEEELIKIPPMLIQPILENAVKYGGDGEAVKVDMHVKELNKILFVTIEDNGTGFGTHAPHHKSASLDIIKNRLARLGKGGGLDVGKGALGGAKVELRIPV